MVCDQALNGGKTLILGNLEKTLISSNLDRTERSHISVESICDDNVPWRLGWATAWREPRKTGGCRRCWRRCGRAQSETEIFSLIDSAISWRQTILRVFWDSHIQLSVEKECIVSIVLPSFPHRRKAWELFLALLFKVGSSFHDKKCIGRPSLPRKVGSQTRVKLGGRTVSSVILHTPSFLSTLQL